MQVTSISPIQTFPPLPAEKVERVWRYQLDINTDASYVFLIPYSLLNITTPSQTYSSDDELAGKTPMEQYQMLKTWDKYAGATVCLVRLNAKGEPEFFCDEGTAQIHEALKGKGACYIVNILQRQLIQRLGSTLVSTNFNPNSETQPLTLGAPYLDPGTFIMDAKEAARFDALSEIERSEWERSQGALNEIIQEFCTTIQQFVPEAPLLPHERVINSLRILSVVAHRQLPEKFRTEIPALLELFWAQVDMFQKLLEACSVKTSEENLINIFDDSLEKFGRICQAINETFLSWETRREQGLLNTSQGPRRIVKKSKKGHKPQRKNKGAYQLKPITELFTKIPHFLCRFLRCTLTHSDSGLIESVQRLDKLLNSKLEELFPCSFNTADTQHTLNYLIEALEMKIALASELLEFYQLPERGPIVDILEKTKAAVRCKDWMEVNRLLFVLHDTPFMREMLAFAQSEDLTLQPDILDKNYLFTELLFLMHDFNHITRNGLNFKMIDFNAWNWCKEALEKLQRDPKPADFTPLTHWLKETGITFQGGARPLKEIAKTIKKENWSKRIESLEKGLANGRAVGTSYQTFCNRVNTLETEFKQALRTLSNDLEEFQQQVFVAVQETEASPEMLAIQFQQINDRLLHYAEPIADFLTNFKQLFFTPIAEKKAGLNHFSVSLLTTDENGLKPLREHGPPSLVEETPARPFGDQLREIFRRGKTRKILDGVIELLEERRLQYEIVQGGNHRKLFIEGKLVVIPEHTQWKSGTSHAIYDRIRGFLGNSI